MSKNFKTFLKHAAKDYYNQSVNPPVVRASTLIFKSIEEIRKTQNKSIKDPVGGHFTYGREGTSTIFALLEITSQVFGAFQRILVSLLDATCEFSIGSFKSSICIVLN